MGEVYNIVEEKLRMKYLRQDVLPSPDGNTRMTSLNTDDYELAHIAHTMLNRNVTWWAGATGSVPAGKLFERIVVNWLKYGGEPPEECKSVQEVTIWARNKIINSKILMHRIAVVGVGGFMTNLLYIIATASRLHLEQQGVNTERQLITIVDDDVFTADNVPRIMMDMSDMPTDPIMVEDFMHNDRIMSKTYIVSRNRLLQQAFSFQSNNTYMNRHLLRTYRNGTDHRLFIGSPDIQTRKLMHEEEANFLFFGHHGDTCEIWYRPDVEVDLVTETYGKMDVRAFWAGVFDMTLNFMDILMEMQRMKYDDESYEPGAKLAEFKAKYRRSIV